MMLNNHDVHFAVRRLPSYVRDLMKDNQASLMLAGGYIRSVVCGDPVADIDLFVSSKELAEKHAKTLLASMNDGDASGNAFDDNGKRKPWRSDNAYTVRVRGLPVQFIHRWTFDTPQALIASFDFTIACAAIWWRKGDEATSTKGRWESDCDPSFYQDLAAKRLVYRKPVRNEDAGGSILRVLKFYQRGYRIPLDSLGAVVARLMMGVKESNGDDMPREQWLGIVLTGLLREVDPLLDHDGIYSEDEETK